MRYFFNGKIITQDPGRPRAHAMTVSEGRVLALDEHPPAQAEAIDLQGRTVVPGFIDAHIHIWKVGDLLTQMLDLRGVRSREEMSERLLDFMRRHPEKAWITARGFNEALFPDGRMPTRSDLDAVAPDRPCLIIRTCAHIAVLNSKALEVCGINAETPPPPGGEIRLDAAGRPNGVLTETALGLAMRHVPAPTPEDYRQMILAAQKALLKAGITAAADPAVMPDLLEVYRQMERDKALKMRVHAFPIVVPDGAAQALPLPTAFHSDFLKVDTVKFFADGGISGQTAALHHPYKNSSNRGVLRLTREFFLPLARSAQAAGWRIATHAIGDAAIDLVLEVYGQLDRDAAKALEHRIEHLGLPDAGHLAAMRALNAICVTQPIFLRELGLNFRQYLPEAYLNRLYPYRSILDQGVTTAFSSDAPVVRDFSPLAGIAAAVTRLDATGVSIGAEQTITVEEALTAYTAGAARANGALDTGRLIPGNMADFVVLSTPILEVSPSEIDKIEVLSTWVGGITVNSEQ